MLAQMVFVLVILAQNGTAQRFAVFETMEQCESFAQTYNAANKGFGRAACVPENTQSKADIRQDFDQAMTMMEHFMDRMDRAMKHQKKEL